MPMYDVNTAKQRLGQTARANWGRDLSDNDFSAIGGKVGYTGGDIDEDLMTRAGGALNTYAGEQGWQLLNQTSPNIPPNMTIPPVEPGTTIPPAAPSNGSVAPSAGSTPQPAAPAIDLQSILSGPSAPNPMQQSAQNALMQLLTNSQRAVSLSDPELQPVSDVYRSQRQRGYERQRRGLAERAAATGTRSGGGFDVQAVGALQDASRDTAAFDANLVQGEMGARREQLMQGIQLAQQAGDMQAARDLQGRLALLNATLQQQDIDLRRQLGTSDVDLRRVLGLGSLDLGRGDLDLRNRSLSQQGELGRGSLAIDLMRTLMQDEQFYSGLGLDAATRQALMNQQAIQQLLGAF